MECEQITFDCPWTRLRLWGRIRSMMRALGPWNLCRETTFGSNTEPFALHTMRASALIVMVPSLPPQLSSEPEKGPTLHRKERRYNNSLKQRFVSIFPFMGLCSACRPASKPSQCNEALPHKCCTRNAR